MRIFRNSTAEYLLLISAAYGQLPYRALTFLPLPYENVKDGFQMPALPTGTGFTLSLVRLMPTQTAYT